MAKYRNSSRSNNSNPVLAVVLLVGVAGAGYLIYDNRQKIKDLWNRNTGASDPSLPPGSGSVSATGSGSNDFPLTHGSKGAYVKRLQAALMKAYGASVLPKYQDDGIWGNEVDNALISHGLSTSIADIDAYNSIVSVLEQKNYAVIPASIPSLPSGIPATIPTTIPSVIPGAGSKPSGIKPPLETYNLLSSAGYFPINSSTRKNLYAMKLQKLLNYLGITDSSGNKLVEDGSVGPKTISAITKAGGSLPMNYDQFVNFYNGKLNGLSGLGSASMKVITRGDNTQVYDKYGNKTHLLPGGIVLGDMVTAVSGVIEFKTIDGEVAMVAKDKVNISI